LLPEIEREVNHGKQFARLRQVYHALILATWYKENIRASFVNQMYSNRNKVQGIDIQDKDSEEKIYAAYMDAFRRGVYNIIREDYDPYSRRTIPRNYFSGGMNIKPIVTIIDSLETTGETGDMALIAAKFDLMTGGQVVSVDTPSPPGDRAMLSKDFTDVVRQQTITVNQILSGERSLSAEDPAYLEAVLDNLSEANGTLLGSRLTIHGHRLIAQYVADSEMRFAGLRGRLLHPSTVGYNMAVKEVVNPNDRPLVGAYGASGSGIYQYLLATNAVTSYFVERHILSYDRLKALLDRYDRPTQADREAVAEYVKHSYLFGFGKSPHERIQRLNKDYLSARNVMENLRALGLRKEDITIERVRSYQDASGQIVGFGRPLVRIRFPWRHPGSTVTKEYSVTYIDRTDLLHLSSGIEGQGNKEKSRRLAYLKHVLSGGIDIYYQHAAVDVPDHINNLI
ncbi:MAG: hypothetical protein K8I00_02020, partial [Candidatus Omnitrophica bacterium]|nr:hypothetical protein [Candidatus Omnitrophota bacterium]